ncbi:MAG: hypothetical protein V8Q30_09890 [Acutalibacteraceae bacterium]
MTAKTYFEELSYALRRRELLPRSLEEDGLLPVEWNGRILCRVTESGVVRYDHLGGHQQGKGRPGSGHGGGGDGDGVHDTSGECRTSEGGWPGGRLPGAGRVQRHSAGRDRDAAGGPVRHLGPGL